MPCFHEHNTVDYAWKSAEINPASAWVIAPFRAIGWVFDGAANWLQGVLNILQNPQLVLLHAATGGVFLSLLRNQYAVALVDDQVVYDFFFGRVVVLRAAKNELRNERQRQYLFDLPFCPKRSCFRCFNHLGFLDKICSHCYINVQSATF